jgi:uncharacterized repeat protein (TIGR01451 family)
VGPAGSPVATYRYDGDNLRTIKVDGVSGSARYYVHGPGGQILTEFEEPCPGNRQLVRDYVYAGEKLLADVKPAVPAVQVAFAQTSSSVSEGAGTLSVTVQVTGDRACPVYVQYATADGSAKAGTDYEAKHGVLSFAVGEDVKAIPLTLAPDNSACQADRSFSVQLFDASSATIASGIHTVTIREDDLVCLSGTKSVSGTFTAGGAVDYTVVLANAGSHSHRDNAGHEFTDVLPSSLTLDSVTASSGVGSRTGNTAFWDGTVAPGGSVAIALHAHLNPDAAAQLVANTGNLSYDLHDAGTNAQTAVTNRVAFMVGSGPISFYTVAPCRIVDTRNPNGPVGGPALRAGSSRVFPIASYCRVAPGAISVSLNVTVTGATASGDVALYPAGITPPVSSTVNYVAGVTRANNAVVLLNGGQLEALCRPTGTTHLIIDVNGYFQ